MGLECTIKAIKKEEFEHVYNALKRFKEFYRITGKGRVYAERMFDENINIYPELGGQILNIELSSSEAEEACLLKSSPAGCDIWIDARRYYIKFENKDIK